MDAPRTRHWLFLDDSEHRHLHFRTNLAGNLSSVVVDYVYTAKEAIDALAKKVYDCVYLDHDLEDTDPAFSGQVVAEYIALHQHQIDQPKFVVIHSHNPDGALRMKEALKDCGMPVVLKPFTVA